MPHKLNVVVVGAGLSGLSTAIACAQGGHEVLVIESAKELAEVHWKKREHRAMTDTRRSVLVCRSRQMAASC